jgi:site-specific DNA recombinase
MQEKIKVVGYIRVSTDNQVEDGQGLEIQEDIIRKYCKAQKDFELVKIYIDPGISGATIEKRPGLLELLSNAREKKFKKVIVAKLDRIARDTFATLWIEKEFKKYDVELFSIAEPYRWDDPAQKVFLQMISVFAEFEKSRITERLVSGRIKKFDKGGYAGGNLSLGYNSIEGRLEVNEQEAETVRLIKKLRKSGLSMQSIARRLNNEHINTKRGGKGWYASTVLSVLKNGIYKGKIRYTGKVGIGVHQPIAVIH